MTKSIVEIAKDKVNIRLRYTLISVRYQWNDKDQLWQILAHTGYKEIKETLTQQELEVIILTNNFYLLVHGPCSEQRMKQLNDIWYREFVSESLTKKRQHYIKYHFDSLYNLTR